jgi:hypothetical protein
MLWRVQVLLQNAYLNPIMLAFLVQFGVMASDTVIRSESTCEINAPRSISASICSVKSTPSAHRLGAGLGTRMCSQYRRERGRQRLGPYPTAREGEWGHVLS